MIKRIPSLDGIRAVAIIFVLIDHINGTQGAAIPGLWWIIKYTDIGLLGVRIFFVLSGFLITTLLLDEYTKTQSISLSRFYFRRTLRIFPPYYLFLLIVFLLTVTGFVSINDHELLYAVTYTSNYAERSYYLNHTWSLSVEEQFYLIVPVALYFLGKKKALYLSLVLIFLSPFIRMYGYTQSGLTFNAETFGAIYDGLLYGCLLAGVREQLWEYKFYRSVLQYKYFILLAPVCAVIFSSLYMHPKLYYLFAIAAMYLCIAATIDWSIRNPDSSAGKVLNYAPVVFIGKISYSLYLWQQLFLKPFSPYFLQTFPINIICTFLVATVSHYYIEKPALLFRDTFENRFLK